MLRPDDFKRGQYITAVNSVRYAARGKSLISFFGGGDCEPTIDTGYVGVLLRIKAVCLPFVSVEHMQTDGKFGAPFMLDVRGLSFVRVPASFRRSLVTKQPTYTLKKSCPGECVTVDFNGGSITGRIVKEEE